MPHITLIKKTTSKDSEGDWDTAIDYVLYNDYHVDYELIIDDTPILIRLTESWKIKSYYTENESTGGYGPEMERESEELTGKNACIKWYDFDDPENSQDINLKDKIWLSFIDSVVNLDKGKKQSIIIPLDVYAVISEARMNESLHAIFKKHIPDYQRYTDYC